MPLDQCGAHLSPKEWRECPEQEEDKVVLNMRNDYEWEARATLKVQKLLPCKTFKEFKDYSEQFKIRTLSPETTKVLMYCLEAEWLRVFLKLVKATWHSKCLSAARRHYLNMALRKNQSTGWESFLCLTIGFLFLSLMKKRLL